MTIIAQKTKITLSYITFQKISLRYTTFQINAFPRPVTPAVWWSSIRLVHSDGFWPGWILTKMDFDQDGFWPRWILTKLDFDHVGFWPSWILTKIDFDQYGYLHFHVKESESEGGPKSCSFSDQMIWSSVKVSSYFFSALRCARWCSKKIWLGFLFLFTNFLRVFLL